MNNHNELAKKTASPPFPCAIINATIVSQHTRPMISAVTELSEIHRATSGSLWKKKRREEKKKTNTSISFRQSQSNYDVTEDISMWRTWRLTPDSSKKKKKWSVEMSEAFSSAQSIRNAASLLSLPS